MAPGVGRVKVAACFVFVFVFVFVIFIACFAVDCSLVLRCVVSTDSIRVGLLVGLMSFVDGNSFGG